MPNAITMLKSDHATEREIKQREALVSQIEREIKMHSQIEEEVFYPAFKAKTENTEASASAIQRRATAGIGRVDADA